jgi:hypothetical protein
VKELMGGCIGEGRPLRKYTGRWEFAVCSDNRRIAPDTDLEGTSKKGRTLEKGDRGGHGPKTGRSARAARVTPPPPFCREFLRNYNTVPPRIRR